MLSLENFKAVKLDNTNVHKITGGEIYWYQHNLNTGISYSRDTEGSGATMDTKKEG